MSYVASRREWLASALEGAKLETTGLKPKSAQANLEKLLAEHYGTDVDVEWQEPEYPPALQAKMSEMDRMTEIVERIHRELPLLRYDIAREMSSLHVGQTQIAARIGLSQPYTAQLLQLPPEKAKEKLLEAAKRKR